MPLNRAALARASISAALLAGLLVLRPGLIGLAPRSVASLIALLIVLIAGIAGIGAIRQFAGGVFGTVRDQRLMLWRNLVAWSMYSLLAILIASELGINVSGLLLGGAIVGVVAASGAQAPVSNFFAGLILLAGRPFAIGDTVRLRSSMASSVEYEGTVVDSRAFYTTLITADGHLLRLPNSAVMSSVVLIGGAPLQADLDLELEEGTDIGWIRRGLEERLPAAAMVEIRPRLLDADAHRMSCRVRIRCQQSIPTDEVARALTEAAEVARDQVPVAYVRGGVVAGRARR
jgi:small-conductance mechanosensitive channel